MDSGSFVIRIHLGDHGPVPGNAVDWTVDPESVTFAETLEVISCRILPGSVILAFEYEDEDGDRITVRSEEEMANMISYYVAMIQDSYDGAPPPPPLSIYPRVGKPAEKRNIHGLKVQVRSSSEMSSPVESPMVTDQDSGSLKQACQDIREILAGGTISDSELQYLELLGSGSAGTVYKADHVPTGTTVAVKVIPLDITPEVQKQMISELEILYRCNSSVIIGFYGAFFQENQISMCTEFMDGGSLDKYGQIEEAVLYRVAAAVVKGLNYLWSLRIMHRDVKPSNILVNTKGFIKLCDFGVSVQLVNSIAKTFIGTNAYMAPERMRGQDYSIRSDVWSLGVSLFEMAMGKIPFQLPASKDAQPIEFINLILKPPPPQLPKGVFSEAFVDLVSQCMKKDPKQRPTPEQLLQHQVTKEFNAEDKQVVALWLKSRLEVWAASQPHTSS